MKYLLILTLVATLSCAKMRTIIVCDPDSDDGCKTVIVYD